MPCKLTKSLQEAVATTPRLLDSKEWKDHLRSCPSCYREALIYDKSLDLYIQLEKSQISQFPELQVWDQIQHKTHKQKFFSKKSVWATGLAIAATLMFVLGLSGWSDLVNPPQYEKPIAVNSIPAEYANKIIEIQQGQSFGPQAAHIQLVWTQQHFGISIVNQQRGNYSTISIGAAIPQEFAHQSIIDAEFLSELAYLFPKNQENTHF